MNFGKALKRLKSWKRIRRAGWTDKGMWLTLITVYGVAHELTYEAPAPRPDLLPWIGLRTADNNFVPWLASQTDILAEDWEVVG